MDRWDGLLLIDKPAGPTSFAVIDRVRRTLIGTAPVQPRSRTGSMRRYRVGHAGTLDPLASGLLLVMAGRATRLAPFLIGLDKTYEAEIGFGVGTDSLDRDGRVVDTAVVPADPAVLERAAAAFRGESEQTPPIFSALKRGGRALYARARSGEQVAPPAPRRVRIARLEVEIGPWGTPAPNEPDSAQGRARARGPASDPTPAVAPDGRVYRARITVSCSSGTYVRALARDLAAAVGTVGHVRELRRLAVGPFAVAEALPPAALDDGAALRGAGLPLAGALPFVPTVAVDWREASDLRAGVQPDPGWRPTAAGPASPADAGAAVMSGSVLQIHDPGGELVAVCRRDAGGGWRTAAVFPVTALESSQAPEPRRARHEES